MGNFIALFGSLNLTEHYQVLKTQNLSIAEFYVVQKGQSGGF